MTDRERLDFDTVIVGAGPAGLSAALRLSERCPKRQIAVLEKASTIGAHILSGAVLDPRALDALCPDWRDSDAPIGTAVTQEKFLLLRAQSAQHLPIPGPMRNHNNTIISLGALCRWLAKRAATYGVHLFPGFAGQEILFDANGSVCGVATGDTGLDKKGEQTANYQEGVALHAPYTLLAEGCRGSLSQHVMQHYALRQSCQPQTYGIGFKEVWRVPKNHHQPGLVIHTVGWPLLSDVYGGGFIYHLADQQVAVGFVVGLDYSNPFLNPFEEFQRFKTHPKLRLYFEDGERVSFGARALNEGGLQAIPKLIFPGGALIGCSAGFLNVAKIKGTHTAMQSGLYAADAIAEALEKPTPPLELNAYPQALRQSWVWTELSQARNLRPGFHYGLWWGLLHAAIDHYIFRGRAPWTLSTRHDHTALETVNRHPSITYPKPDGVLTFDRLSSVYLCHIQHREDQPNHLQLRDAKIAIDVNYRHFSSPEQRYCPAQVYEIIIQDGQPRLRINSQNCIHCKTCDIKDPQQNIHWAPPEGGSGPNYGDM